MPVRGEGRNGPSGLSSVSVFPILGRYAPLSKVSFSVMSGRPNNSAIDAILGDEFPVLNHGFIRVVDYMGGDDAVVQAARVSYGSGTKSVRDDRALIRYLLSHNHTT